MSQLSNKPNGSMYVPEGGYYDQQAMQNAQAQFANFHIQSMFMQNQFKEQTLWKSLRDAGHQAKLDIMENTGWGSLVGAGVGAFKKNIMAGTAVGATIGAGFGYMQSGWNNVVGNYSDASAMEKFMAKRDLMDRGSEFGSGVMDALGMGLSYAVTAPLGFVGGWVGGDMLSGVYDDVSGKAKRDSYFAMKPFVSGIGNQVLGKGTSNSVLGRGFTRKEETDVAHHLANIATTMNMGNEELQEVITKMANNDMLNGIGSADQFKEKTEKLIGNFKLLVDVIGKTQDEAVQIMTQMDQVGVNGTNAFKMMNHAQMISGATGANFGAVHQKGLYGAAAVQGSGTTGAAGYALNSSITTSVEAAIGAGQIDQNTAFQLGGAEGISRMMFQNVLRGQNSSLEKLAGLYAYDTNTRSIDVNRYSDAMNMDLATLQYEARRSGGTDKYVSFNAHRQQAYSDFMSNGGGDLMLLNQMRNIQEVAGGLPGGMSDTNLILAARKFGYNSDSFRAMVGTARGLQQRYKPRFDINSIQNEDSWYDFDVNFGITDMITNSGLRAWYRNIGESSYQSFLKDQYKVDDTLYEETGIIPELSLGKGSMTYDLGVHKAGIRKNGFLTIADDPTDMKDVSEYIEDDFDELSTMDGVLSLYGENDRSMTNKDDYRLINLRGKEYLLNKRKYDRIAKRTGTALNSMNNAYNATDRDIDAAKSSLVSGVGMRNSLKITDALMKGAKQAVGRNGLSTHHLSNSIVSLDKSGFKSFETFYKAMAGTDIYLDGVQSDPQTVSRIKDEARRQYDQMMKSNMDNAYFSNLNASDDLNKAAIARNGEHYRTLIQGMAENSKSLNAVNFAFNDMNEAAAFFTTEQTGWIFDTELEDAAEIAMKGSGIDAKEELATGALKNVISMAGQGNFKSKQDFIDWATKRGNANQVENLMNTLGYETNSQDSYDKSLDGFAQMIMNVRENAGGDTMLSKAISAMSMLTDGQHAKASGMSLGQYNRMKERISGIKTESDLMKYLDSRKKRGQSRSELGFKEAQFIRQQMSGITGFDKTLGQLGADVASEEVYAERYSDIVTQKDAIKGILDIDGNLSDSKVFAAKLVQSLDGILSELKSMKTSNQ